MAKYFVWIQGMRYPEAQIWTERPINGNGKLIVQPLFEHELTNEEAKLSLDELILKFKNKVELCNPRNTEVTSDELSKKQ